MAFARVERTNGGQSFEVVCDAGHDGHAFAVRFGCQSEQHAEALAAQINDCAWVEAA